MTFTIREPGSALTHMLAALLTMIGATPLLIRAVMTGSAITFAAMVVFITSMLLLYTASTLYHSLNIGGKVLTYFRKIDHMMIFVLIAGSYTPVCLLVLEPVSGRLLLCAVWGLALLGILIKAVWITCPKWLSSIIYISMGWTCLGVFGQLIHNLSSAQFGLLVAGGVFYTVGGVIYALKFPVFGGRFKYFGAHELFHVFVMLGSACHFIFMFLLQPHNF